MTGKGGGPGGFLGSSLVWFRRRKMKETMDDIKKVKRRRRGIEADMDDQLIDDMIRWI